MVNDSDSRGRNTCNHFEKGRNGTHTKSNLKVGDIVILQEANTIRNDCQMCKVMKTYCNEKGFVRNVRLKIGSVDQGGRNNIVDIPVSKIVLFLESEEVDERSRVRIPAKEATN